MFLATVQRILNQCFSTLVVDQESAPIHYFELNADFSTCEEVLAALEKGFSAAPSSSKVDSPSTPPPSAVPNLKADFNNITLGLAEANLELR